MFKVKKQKNRPSAIKTVRFPEELSEKLFQIAAREDVSFNELVIQCCTYAINDYTTEEEEIKEKRWND